jgi:hypothetical protein
MIKSAMDLEHPKGKMQSNVRQLHPTSFHPETALAARQKAVD